MLSDHRLRYLIVGGFSAAVHNAIMIGGAALGLNFVFSSAISYLVVVLEAFALHSYFTFSVRPSLGAFVKYAAGMALNYPVWIGLMFLLNDLAHIPMLLASPIGTVLMLIWNFAVSRWAILRRHEPARPVTSETP